MNEFFQDNEIKNLDKKLVDMLTAARRASGVPFVITSGFRAEAANAKVGGVEDSSHTKGLAVDIRASGSQIRFKMMAALVAAGFKRIGLYNAHIHVDIDPTKPQNVIWTGASH